MGSSTSQSRFNCKRTQTSCRISSTQLKKSWKARSQSRRSPQLDHQTKSSSLTFCRHIFLLLAKRFWHLLSRLSQLPSTKPIWKSQLKRNVKFKSAKYCKITNSNRTTLWQLNRVEQKFWIRHSSPITKPSHLHTKPTSIKLASSIHSFKTCRERPSIDRTLSLRAHHRQSSACRFQEFQTQALLHSQKGDCSRWTARRRLQIFYPKAIRQTLILIGPAWISNYFSLSLSPESAKTALSRRRTYYHQLTFPVK